MCNRVTAVSAILLSSLLLGCTVVGPNAIRNGRLAYNEAITETNNQQMLMVLVHNRYEESNHLLAVSSVTANVTMSSRAAIEAGFGDSDNYAGNLVPFSGGFVYEENPTISYTPVTGETYLRQLTSPVPLSLITQITQSLPYTEYVYEILLSSVNDIRNPTFLFDTQQDDPRFDRFVAIITELTRQHCLRWTTAIGSPGQTSLILKPSTTATVTRSQELLGLLGLPASTGKGEERVISVTSGGLANTPDSITINTYTTWNLVETLSAAVQVPVADEKSGIASPMPRLGRAGRNLQIRYASSRPETAYVAVEHRDGWFYIDSTDLATKRYFKLLGNLWSAAMARSTDTTSSTPVLTVPVSR